MTLQASGQISLSQVNTELSLAATTEIALNATNVRTLAGVASGQISLSNLYGKTAGAEPGQVVFGMSGSYSWTAPAGVTAVSVACVGAGTGATYLEGGRGGATAYKNNIPVTPGNTYTVFCGFGGLGSLPEDNFTAGSGSYFISTVTVHAKAFTDGSASVGDHVSSGGNAAGAFGGGGAGGYAGPGANADTAGAPGSGAGGGGASAATVVDYPYEYRLGSGGGGGTGLKGLGTSGAAGINGGGGGGGSGGTAGGSYSGSGVGASGGRFGGGGGAGTYEYDVVLEQVTQTYAGGDGGAGGVRIMWGGGRSYPSNAADIVPSGSQSFNNSFRLQTGAAPYTSSFVTSLPTTSLTAGVQVVSNINDAANAALRVQPPLSIYAWVYMTSFVQNGVILDIPATTHSPPYYSLHVRVASNGKLFVGYNIAGSYTLLDSVSPNNVIPLNEWVHVGVVLTTSQLITYVNGREHNSKGHSLTSITYYNKPVTIGQAPNFTPSLFPGIIGSVRIIAGLSDQAAVRADYLKGYYP